MTEDQDREERSLWMRFLVAVTALTLGAELLLLAAALALILQRIK